MVCKARTRVTAPVEIAGKKYMLSWHVVDAPIPLLWGKQSMKKAEVVLDLPNDRVRIKSTWVNLAVSSCNHYRLNMLPERVAVIKEVCGNNENSKEDASGIDDKMDEGMINSGGDNNNDGMVEDEGVE